MYSPKLVPLVMRNTFANNVHQFGITLIELDFFPTGAVKVCIGVTLEISKHSLMHTSPSLDTHRGRTAPLCGKFNLLNNKSNDVLNAPNPSNIRVEAAAEGNDFKLL